MSTEEQLAEIIHKPYQTMADGYIRANEILEFVKGFMLINVDDMAYVDDIDTLTINKLSAMLQDKIDMYEKYVATDKDGVFALKQ
jgi:hypothetical protein